MEIPIYIDGERTGTLTISRQGRLTALEARLRDPGRVVRLRVFGAREAWYLGIPEPESGELRLLRRVTPAALRGFPQNPLYAAEERMEKAAAKGPSPAELPEGRHVLWLGGRPYYF